MLGQCIAFWEAHFLQPSLSFSYCKLSLPLSSMGHGFLEADHAHSRWLSYNQMLCFPCRGVCVFPGAFAFPPSSISHRVNHGAMRAPFAQTVTLFPLTQWLLIRLTVSLAQLWFCFGNLEICFDLLWCIPIFILCYLYFGNPVPSRERFSC